jgi:hypothetical protein
MVDKNYWSSDLPHPLSPNVIDVALYENYMVGGSSLLLGCTKGLLPLSDRQLDLDPWYDSPTVIVGDWRDNKHYYSNILLDGGLCFTKELCDEILEMASKNCKRFISRSFDKKLEIMKIANYFPSENDFKYKPKFIARMKNDYTFYVWEF